MRFLTVAQPRVRLYQRFIPDFLPRDGVNQTGILFLSLVTRFLYRAKILNENETFIIRIFFSFFFRIIMLYLIYHFYGNIFTHMEKINVADKYYGYGFKCSFNFSYFISREIQLLSKNISIRMFPFAMPTCCHALWIYLNRKGSFEILIAFWDWLPYTVLKINESFPYRMFPSFECRSSCEFLIDNNIV